VTSSTRSEVVDALLAGVPLPDGFEVEALKNVGGVNGRYQEIAHVSGAVVCGWLDVWFDAEESADAATAQVAADALATSTSRSMLVGIEAQGGWSGAIWETADAINGGPGIATGGGLAEPDRESSESASAATSAESDGLPLFPESSGV
jgi:hypothetical protein